MGNSNASTHLAESQLRASQIANQCGCFEGVMTTKISQKRNPKKKLSKDSTTLTEEQQQILKFNGERFSENTFRNDREKQYFSFSDEDDSSLENSEIFDPIKEDV